jgi:hypothetical protein
VKNDASKKTANNMCGYFVISLHKPKYMKLKKLFLALLFTAVSVGALNAQRYNTALGVRLGYDNGMTLKHFFSYESAGEFIFAVSPHYFHLTGLYEYRQPVAGTPGLDWYAGLGGHIGESTKTKTVTATLSCWEPT